MKRIVALLLLLSLCFPLFACAGKNDDDIADRDTEDYPFIDSLPEELNGKYRGKDFIIALDATYRYEMFADESSKEQVDQMVRNRNELIESRFGVKLKMKETTPTAGALHTSHRDYINNCLNNGQNDFDLIMAMAYTAGETITDGNYLDFRSYTTYCKKSLDAGAEWWPEQINNDATIMGRQYLAVSDLCLTAMEYCYIVVFNKTLVGTKNLAQNFFGRETLYDVVDDGDWTLENFRLAVKDLWEDGPAGLPGEVDSEDVFGLVATRHTDVDAWAYALGFHYVENNGKDAPSLWQVDTRASDAVEALRKLYSSGKDNRGFYMTEYAGVDPTKNPQACFDWQNQFFADGHACFILTPMIELKSRLYHDMADNFGVLPYPKYDEAQLEYRTGLVPYYTTLAIPVFDHGSVELIDIMVEALSAESANSVRETYYNATLKADNADEANDMRMIDLIMNNRVFDLSVYHYNQITRTPNLGNNWADQALGTIFRYLLRRNKDIEAADYWVSYCKDMMEEQFAEVIAEYESMAKA